MLPTDTARGVPVLGTGVHWTRDVAEREMLCLSPTLVLALPPYDSESRLLSGRLTCSGGNRGDEAVVNTTKAVVFGKAESYRGDVVVKPNFSMR